MEKHIEEVNFDDEEKKDIASFKRYLKTKKGINEYNELKNNNPSFPEEYLHKKLYAERAFKMTTNDFNKHLCKYGINLPF